MTDFEIPVGSEQVEGEQLDIFRLSRQLRDLRRRKEQLEQQLKDLNAELKHVNGLLANEMVNNELQRFSIDGVLFYLATDVYVQEIAGVRDEFYEVVRGEGFGDLIKPSVPHQTLKAFVKEQMQENNDELPGWLAPYVRTYKEDKVRMVKDR